jgi:hypothetical protein
VIFFLAKPDDASRLGGMKTDIYVPNSLRAAGGVIRAAVAQPLDQMTATAFVRAWCCVTYLFPGLHPDGWEDADSGWPCVLRRFPAEAWRRADAGALSDEELYPCDAQWAGLYDRMAVHAPDETERRVELAAAFGDAVNA